jgi:hypothetical protein
VQGSLSLLGTKSLKYPLLSETQPCPGDNTTVGGARSPARPAVRARGGQSALLLILPFLPQAAAPAAPWAVPSVPRAVQRGI